ncbi:MAG: hypothetical protein ABWW69_02010 [Pyrodictiaceae archaeon]
MKYCTICGKRKAFYYHRISGNYVCDKCLRRIIIKNIKKAFGLYKLIAEIRPEIVYVIDPCYPLASITGLSLFSLAEKGFTEKISLAVPEEAKLDIKEIKNYSYLNVDKIYFTDYSIVDTLDPAERVRGIKALIVKSRELNGADNSRIYVALPYTRDHIVFFMLRSMLAPKPHLVPDYMPRHVDSSGKTIFIMPFYEVALEDLAAYSIIAKSYELARRIMKACKMRRDVYEEEMLRKIVYSRGSELIYSSYKTLSYFAEGVAANPHLAKCRLCRGYEYKSVLEANDGYCRTCKTIVKGRGANLSYEALTHNF